MYRCSVQVCRHRYGRKGKRELNLVEGANTVSGAKVIVCYASRYGSTKRIAECIAGKLRSLGISVDCLPAGRDIDFGIYDAAVLGSPLYMGKWLAEARELVSRERGALGGIPVAVFSVGCSFRDQTDKVLESGRAALSDILLYISPRDSAFFPGKIDMALLRPEDRAILTLAHMPGGDFQDMDMVKAWAGKLPGVLGLPL